MSGWLYDFSCIAPFPTPIRTFIYPATFCFMVGLRLSHPVLRRLQEVSLSQFIGLVPIGSAAIPMPHQP